MGYLRPIAIIVTGHYDRSLDTTKNIGHWADHARNKAYEIFGKHGLGMLVSYVQPGVANNERSFFIAWDGSKEGWAEDEEGDEARIEYIAWLRQQAYGPEVGNGPLDWVEIQYGGDDGVALVLSHNNDDNFPEA